MSPHPPYFWDGSRWRWLRRKTSCPLCNLNTLWDIRMILGRNVEQNQDNVSRTRITTFLLFLPFLLLASPPFVMSDSD